MVERDNFRLLNEKEKAQYKFIFCRNCSFYECELIGEYTQFKANHLQELMISDCVGAIQSHFNEDFITNVRVTVASQNSSDQNNDVENCSHFDDVDSSDKYTISYDQSNLKDDCIMSYRHVNQIECGRKRVSDGIGDHYKIELNYDGTIKDGIENRWEPIQSVFISAQTGQGKNYFIENVLIPYVKELNYKNKTNQKVLILSNRLALQKQIKNHLNENTCLEDNEDREVYTYNEVADVMTYHSVLRRKDILEKIQKKIKTRYIYVICDEAHFFTSDAMFNPHTQKILYEIIRLFQDAVRVYMSATPYECLEYIIKDENRYRYSLNFNKPQHKCKYSSMVFYHFKRDYGYLDIKYYSAIEDLYEIIVKSVNKRREKWLIFIDDIEKCKNIKERLEQVAKEMDSPFVIKKDESKTVEKVYSVDASSKKDLSYMKIINNEMPDKNTYVLISTSVLDNGVNLNGIDNIVVSDMEKVKCLQMVGRARVSDTDDHKTLYIKRFDVGYVEKRIRGFEAQKDAYHMYEVAYNESEQSYTRSNTFQFLEKYYNGNEKDWKDAKHWFGRSMNEPTNLYLNMIAKTSLDKLILQYKFILDEMKEESKEGKEHIGQKYLEYQLSLFGKTYCVDDDITFADKEKAKKEFIAFLESYAESGEQIDKEKQEKFKIQFTKLYDTAFDRADPNLDRCYGIRKMNGLLEGQHIDYEIENHRVYWEVLKCEE